MSTPASTSPDATSQHKSSASPNQNGDAQQQSNGAEKPNGLDEGYPEQKHAGAVGLGPEYGKMHSATTTDKMIGLKDEIVGKLSHNPEKVEHGREMRSGELKKKQFEESEQADPFKNADGDKGNKKDEQKVDDKGPSSTEHDEGDNIAGNAAPTSVTGKRGPGTHPTETGAQEQAATTAPEGTAEAEDQRNGEVVNKEKQIDESSSKKVKTE